MASSLYPRLYPGLLLCVCVLPACGGSMGSSSKASAPQPPRTSAQLEAPPAPPAPEAAPVGGAAMDTAASGDGASVNASPGATSTPASSGTSGADPSAPPAEGTMLDIEAHVALRVDAVTPAAARVRALTKEHGGQVIDDQLDSQDGSATENLTLRVPSRGAEGFIAALERLGVVLSRQVHARDVGKEYYDAQLQLRNLETALKRYQEIMKLAKEVKEILLIEAEMTRLSGEIERVKGNLRFLRDRAARATIHLVLSSKQPQLDAPPAEEPTAKLWPGLRVGGVFDLRGGSEANGGYLGGGLGLRVGRIFSLDLEGFKATAKASSGLDLFLATVGGEIFSDLFGAGSRRWFNPYLGLRAGYARMLSHDEMALGGTVGVEVFKNKTFLVDTQLRSLALFGNKHVDPHVLLQPMLALHMAF